MVYIEDKLNLLESRLARLERIALRQAMRVRRMIQATAKRPRPRTRAAAPTYASGSSDKVYDLAKMPTRYIVNCLNMADYRLVRGLRRVLQAELAKRNARDKA